ncbi:hypothetical protein [Pseudoalteromonas sp. T1lg88]|uniref:hypothetical protein n=1 Tax=Pseudoalteromonas sp. T1lg88 TaxID=2077104 RepID=UPI000CF732F6|nr:hypothetical protein [Pseudoalteromonas sp. T1lg88]
MSLKRCNRSGFAGGFLISLMVLFLLYNVEYTFFFGLGSRYLILGGLALVSLFLVRRVNKFTLVAFLISLFLLSFSILNAIHNGHYELTYLKVYFVVSLCVVSVPAFIKLISSGAEVGQGLRYFGYAAFINSIFIFSMFISPSFRDFYLSFLKLEVYELFGSGVADSLLLLRMVGVSGFSGYSTAFTQMLCLILYYVYIMKFREQKKMLKSDYILFFIVISSSFIVSRSTIVGVAFLLFFGAFDRRNLKSNIFFILFFIFMMISVVFSLSFVLPENQYEFFKGWVFEFFQSGAETGSVKSNLEMYKYTLYDFSIFGDARLLNGSGGYYMGTDVGYFRVLFSSGYIGLFLLLGFLFFLTRPISLSGEVRVFSLLLLSYILVFMLKGYILQDAFFIYLLLIVFSLTYCDRVKKCC